jgi:hypothetical protein
MSITRIVAFGVAAALLLACNKPNPCALLSANEAEVYVGVLVAPPYRTTDDGVPDASGESCMFRGSDGRQFTVARMKGGAKAGQAMTDAKGPWDHATWIPGGSLMVTKGDNAVHVDVSAASGKEDDAVAIAKQIMPRLDHPLDYKTDTTLKGPWDNATLLVDRGHRRGFRLDDREHRREIALVRFPRAFAFARIEPQMQRRIAPPRSPRLR